MAAGQTKTVATTATGTITTYVITDGSGNTLTVVVNQINAGSGRSTSFASSGALLQDGIVLLATLTQRLASETTPDQQF
jgi:hypothetical protein